jgi:hypothetical protein
VFHGACVKLSLTLFALRFWRSARLAIADEAQRFFLYEVVTAFLICRQPLFSNQLMNAYATDPESIGRLLSG